MSIQFFETIKADKADFRDYIRGAWDRVRFPEFPEGETMTQQHHKDLTDINHIVARYDRTGQLPQGRVGQYGDVSGLNAPLQELVSASQNTIRTADSYLAQQAAQSPSSTDQPKADSKASTDPAQSTPTGAASEGSKT